ncbi:hypothetical protein [Halostagnicola kamekurae]|uniref:hypothetical protein n=1 Tax=Halostagnicola kamekurae TaxID=619731 RepID=UPI0015877C60|nr:hypothetical protein [Halostagnicola kamekurae]
MRQPFLHCGIHHSLALLERVDRVPPAVLRALGDHDYGIMFTQPQGDHLVVEVK